MAASIEIGDKTYRVATPLGTLRGRVAARIASGLVEQLQDVNDQIAVWQAEYRKKHAVVIRRDSALEAVSRAEELLEKDLTEDGRREAEAIRDGYQARIEQMRSDGRDFVEIPGEASANEVNMQLVRLCLERFEDEAFALIALFLIPDKQLAQGWLAGRLERDKEITNVLDGFANDVLNQAPLTDVLRVAAEAITVYRDEVLSIVGEVGKLLNLWTEPTESPTPEVSTTSSQTSSTQSAEPTVDTPETTSSSESDSTSSTDSRSESSVTASVS